MKELKALRKLANIMNAYSWFADIEGMTIETPDEPVEVSYYVHAESDSGKIADVWFYEDLNCYEVHENDGKEWLMPIGCIDSLIRL